MLGGDLTTKHMRTAKQAYIETMEQLKAKKGEYQDMKRANDEERKRLLDEERKAKSFKFTKMEKMKPFLPGLKEREGFEEGYQSLAPGEKYLDSRPKFQILFPDRAKEKGLKFNYTGLNTGGNYFMKCVGQEFDQYDEEMKKAMTKQDRGMSITRLKTKQTFTTADG